MSNTEARKESGIERGEVSASKDKKPFSSDNSTLPSPPPPPAQTTHEENAPNKPGKLEGEAEGGALGALFGAKGGGGRGAGGTGGPTNCKGIDYLGTSFFCT